MSKLIISPSLLASDLSRVGEEAKLVLASQLVKWLHIDVMDGHFVPNIGIGIGTVKSLRQTLGPDVFLDCHLMVSDPGMAGASLITIHWESLKGGLGEAKQICDQIHSLNLMAGLAIKPSTTVSEIVDLITIFDLILVMTVEPGFGGQVFMDGCLEKVSEIRLISTDVHIQVDGGVNQETYQKCIDSGANVIVAGTAIYGNPKGSSLIEEMHRYFIEKVGS